MNRKLLEKQTKELIKFFEKEPSKLIALPVGEHLNFIKGCVFLLQNFNGDFDFTSAAGFFKSETINAKNDLRFQFEKKLSKLKYPDSIEYREVQAILGIYVYCLSEENLSEVDSQKCTELAGFLRPLELERLWINVKK